MDDIKRTDALLRNYSLTIQYDRINGYQLAGIGTPNLAKLLSDLVKQCPDFPSGNHPRQVGSWRDGRRNCPSGSHYGTNVTP